MQLYALCDQDLLDSRNLSLEDFVTKAKQYGVKTMQYRNKNANISYVKQQLILLRQLFDGFLIINDIFELTPFCDGLHVGQEDLQSIDKDIKKAFLILQEIVGKDKLIGLSTHNKEEILIANELDLYYVGLGAYRETSTKDVNTILGDSLDEIASFSVHPVAAIGGVKFEDKFEHVDYLVVGSALI